MRYRDSLRLLRNMTYRGDAVGGAGVGEDGGLGAVGSDSSDNLGGVRDVASSRLGVDAGGGGQDSGDRVLHFGGFEKIKLLGEWWILVV